MGLGGMEVLKRPVAKWEIVAKRKADAYRPETVWYKIKSRTYTQGEGHWELFQKRARAQARDEDSP